MTTGSRLLLCSGYREVWLIQGILRGPETDSLEISLEFIRHHSSLDATNLLFDCLGSATPVEMVACVPPDWKPAFRWKARVTDCEENDGRCSMRFDFRVLEMEALA